MNEIKFKIKDLVYLNTDVEQRIRIVTGVLIRASGVSYALTCGTEESWHYDFEMTKDEDILKRLKN